MRETEKDTWKEIYRENYATLTQIHFTKVINNAARNMINMRSQLERIVYGLSAFNLQQNYKRDSERER